MFCNACFNRGNGDVIAAIQHIREVAFPEALRLIGDYLHEKPGGLRYSVSRSSSSGPPRRSWFPTIVEYDSASTRNWRDKKGVSESAFLANGGCLVRDFGRTRIAFPAYAGSFSGRTIPDPVRWIVYSLDAGSIKTQNGDAKVVSRKAFENAPLGLAGLSGLKHLSGAKIIWKVEGVPDMLALFDAIPIELRRRHVVLTNTCGAGENPKPETLEPFRGKTVYVVPDLDDAGIKGGRKWARAIADVAREVRLIELPFNGLDGQKDLRDFFQSGGRYEALLDLAEQTPIVRPEKTEPGDTTYDNRPLVVTAGDILHDFAADILHGDPPSRWSVDEDPASELNRLDLMPERVILIGGAPGAGKTAFCIQAVFGALYLNPDLRALVCSVEMSPKALLERFLASRAGVHLSDITHRRRPDGIPEKLQCGLDEIRKIADRIAFAQTPHSIERIEAAADATRSDVLILDYVQRLKLESDRGLPAKEKISEIMERIRFQADKKRCIIVVSALTRPTGQKGKHDYSAAGVTSFRDSSELEYGSDSAWLLVQPEEGDPDYRRKRMLRHLKNRHGLRKDINLWFDGQHQLFWPALPEESQPGVGVVDGRAAACGDRDEQKTFEEF